MSDTEELSNAAFIAMRNVAAPALVVLLIAVLIPALDVNVQSDQTHSFSASYLDMEGGPTYLVSALLVSGALVLMWRVSSSWTIKAGWATMIFLTLGTFGWLANLLLLQDQLAASLLSEQIYGESMTVAEVGAQHRHLGLVGGELGLSKMLTVGLFSPTLMLIGLVLNWRAFWLLRRLIFLAYQELEDE